MPLIDERARGTFFADRVCVIGPSLAFIVTGVFLTEQLFNIPGVSSITLDAWTLNHQVLACHTCTVWSLLPEAMSFLASGDHGTALTMSVWPL